MYGQQYGNCTRQMLVKSCHNADIVVGSPHGKSDIEPRRRIGSNNHILQHLSFLQQILQLDCLYVAVYHSGYGLYVNLYWVHDGVSNILQYVQLTNLPKPNLARFISVWACMLCIVSQQNMQKKFPVLFQPEIAVNRFVPLVAVMSSVFYD